MSPKILLLFRHGKSDWGATYDRDHNRPLADRGRRAARDMGRWLATEKSLPDSIVCSSAVRTKQTFQHASQAGAWDVPFRYTSQLYGASPEDILELLQEEPDTTHTLMLIGHEPTCSTITHLLTGHSVPHFPTATMARIQLPIASWSDAILSGGTLTWLQKPRELPVQ